MRDRPICLPVLLFVVVLTSLWGCRHRPGDDVRETAESSEPTSEPRPNGPADAGDAPRASLGIDLTTLIENATVRDPKTEELPVLDRLNEPQRVSAEARPNRHVPGQIDTLRTLHYDHVRITVYEVSGGKEILQNVTVTDSRLEALTGVSVGTDRAAVEGMLGEPDERDGDAYVFLQNGPMPTRFYVHFDGDTVGRMEWRFPID